jgi:hypothetical protein
VPHPRRSSSATPPDPASGSCIHGEREHPPGDLNLTCLPPLESDQRRRPTRRRLPVCQGDAALRGRGADRSAPPLAKIPCCSKHKSGSVGDVDQTAGAGAKRLRRRDGCSHAERLVMPSRRFPRNVLPAQRDLGRRITRHNRTPSLKDQRMRNPRSDRRQRREGVIGLKTVRRPLWPYAAGGFGPPCPIACTTP